MAWGVGGSVPAVCCRRGRALWPREGYRRGGKHLIRSLLVPHRAPLRGQGVVWPSTVVPAHLLLFDELVKDQGHRDPPDEKVAHGPRRVLVAQVEVLPMLGPLLDRRRAERVGWGGTAPGVAGRSGWRAGAERAQACGAGEQGGRERRTASYLA